MSTRSSVPAEPGPGAKAAESVLSDAEARRRIACDLDHSLVVVAGAGTGKTTTLVKRVVELVRQGTPLRDLAVITFTEAAAAELRLRVADALSAARRAEPDNQNLAIAVEEVDEAALCTLHAFAQRMLVEHALAAGLPPGFDVLDELSDRVDLETRLDVFTDQLLDDLSAEPMLLRGFALGLGESAMVELAWCLHRHWDRLEDGGLEWIDAHRPPAGAMAAIDVTPVLDALDRALALAGFCANADDRLLEHLETDVAPARAMLAAAAHDEQAVLPLLVGLRTFSCTIGRRENWDMPVAEVRQACADAEAARQELLADVRAPVLAELLARLAHFTVSAAAERAVEGRLTFHDLLVHARGLLRTDDAARAALRRRYRWLLVDEFQDTDPLQVELAAWLSCSVEGSADVSDARPGALFVVGDPKQSIYRFRRADIALFESVTAAVGDEVVLSTNFRSVPGIVAFVNAVFPSLFGDVPEPGQAIYHRLVANRLGLPARPGTAAVQLSLAGIGADEPDRVELAPPPVVVVGRPVEGGVGEVRRIAAAELAQAIRRIRAEQWPVSDPDGVAAPRPARWSDVAVLIPARTALGSLEEA
ncbi:MAG TPA: UvrD-helicase domain-containing protein, partial [Acidimicrobiales bacterium]|nr:UvrD-helicase domain-containing protein [Acidimicrobiales bacterium]